ncbi:MAG: hypothetical protein GY928_37555 [Colwellia sp.]|nr:hypothetical protein [Colwellia sp.]
MLKVKSDLSKDCYVGTLRNAKRFDVYQEVYFALGKNERAVYKGKIVGIEAMPEMNPTFMYKIQVLDNPDYNDLSDIEMDCTTIFDSLERAKESAIKGLDNAYELAKREIERYFDK